MKKSILIVFVLSVFTCNLLQAQIIRKVAIDNGKTLKDKIRQPYKPNKIILPDTARTGTTTTTIIMKQISGIDYKLFEPATKNFSTPKGILVIGSGNDDNKPGKGKLSETTENNLCKLEADNGYVAAIVAYQAGTANPNNGTWEHWNNNAKLMAQDFDKCITDISTKYNVAKSKTVIAGVSYTSFMMLTDIAIDNTLSYAAGLIASCGGTQTWQAQNFKIPIYSLTCSDKYEGDFCGLDLYNQIPASSAIKIKSEGFTDPNCTGHCNGNWLQLMFAKIKFWIP